MAKKPAGARRKLVEFDAEMAGIGPADAGFVQELADEAFGDLLYKYDRPTDLKEALRQSARSWAAGAPHSRSRGKHR